MTVCGWNSIPAASPTRQPVKDNDLPDVVAKWREWDNGNGKKKFKDRTKKAFFVPVDEIRDQKFDLSINRYKDVVYEEPKYAPPDAILKRLRSLEKAITDDLTQLEEMLKQ